ncbi:ankyrin repeat-containing domain protein [Mycena floridula]|nr:ankyrin repeat-containing domain protein [Mycena floridula]
MLVDHGVPINSKDRYQSTILFYTVQKGGPQDYDWVIPPFSYAVKERSMGMVKGLLQHPDVDANCRDSKGWTPLSWAAFWDYEEVVEFLLQHPDIQSEIPDEFGRAPLILAAIYGHESSFRLLFQSREGAKDLILLENIYLLAYAAFGEDQDCHLCTPLSYTTVEGYQDVVQLLLEHDDFYDGTGDEMYLYARVVQKTHNCPSASPGPKEFGSEFQTPSTFHYSHRLCPVMETYRTAAMLNTSARRRPTSFPPQHLRSQHLRHPPNRSPMADELTQP